MRLPPKAVSTICWIQSAGIVGSYLVVHTLFKIYTKISQETFGGRLDTMPWVARCFIAIGPWLLLIPAIWAITAMMRADTEGGIADITELHVIIGYIITVVLTLICVVSIVAGLLGAFVYPFRTI